MDEVERIAQGAPAASCSLAGWSAYPRQLDFARFREIADEVGALLMVDMAHFAGLVAAGLHPNPVPHADVVTSTVHKTIGGARGGLILCRRGARQDDQLGRLPGPAGRPARARHRRQGRSRSRSRGSDLFRERQERTDRRRPDRRRAALLTRPATASTSSPAAPTCTSCSSTCRESELDGQQAGGPAARASASRSTATRSRSTRARRWSPPACASAPPRWRPAASRPTTSRRSATSSPPR